MPDKIPTITGSNGELEINLRTIITSAKRPTHFSLLLQNHEQNPLTLTCCLADNHFLSVSSVQEQLLPERIHNFSSAALLSDPCATLNRNLVHDCVKQSSRIYVPPESRRVFRVELINVCSSTEIDQSTADSKHISLCPFDNKIILRDAATSKEVAALRIHGTTCESWIRPDHEHLDFGHCTIGAWAYRDITLRNLSAIPGRCCFSKSFRPVLESTNTTQLTFLDPESGYELDTKLVRIEPSSIRTIRVAFRAAGPVHQDYWLCLQNLDNAADFWHLRLVAKADAERIAQEILVSCGSELDFGDCYVNCVVFRDIIVQSNYKEDIMLALTTDRLNHVSFEILNDWAMEDTDVTKKQRSRGIVDHDVSSLSPYDASDTGSLKRQSSPLADNLSDQETVSSNTTSIRYYAPQPPERDERVDSHNVAKKKNRIPESVLLKPGQKKGVRVWYLPTGTQNIRASDVRENSDFDPGALQDDTFQLTFELSSGESRIVIAQSRVCESVLRLERTEVHLGNCNVMTRYRTMLSLINCSDLPAFVSINYVSQCVLADNHEVRILPRQAYDLGLEFIPRQVNSGYHKELTISNLRNPKSSNLVFTLRADCVDDQGISLHALFYKILAPNPTNELDFGVTVANHPAIRAIKIRNITDKTLILEFDGCPGIVTYLPSSTSLNAAKYETGRRESSFAKTKCLCQRSLKPKCPGTNIPSCDFASLATANALIDMDISHRRRRPGASIRENLPVWHYESCLADLRLHVNSCGLPIPTSPTKSTSYDNKKIYGSPGSMREHCWADVFSSLSERKVAMLDSMPTFFSNYDSEIRYTERQFRPEQTLRAALRTGCLIAATTLVLDARSESVVVLSLKLTDDDVRGKTKIRPIERHMSVTMVDYDRSRLFHLPEASSKQMHYIAEQFEKSDASRPREVLLTVQACKSRMSVAPLRQLNFGTITCGEQKDKAFTIVNLSEAPLLYELRKAGVGQEDIRFNLGKGTQGVVRPYFTKVVPFIFAPSCEGKFEEKIVVENRLDSSASVVLTVKAQIRAKGDEADSLAGGL